MAEALLSVRNLTITYHTAKGTVRAVRDISFDIAPGEALGLVGETGAGKTTAALGLMGLVPPPGKVESGEILFGSRDLLRLSKQELRSLRGGELSMVFQDPMSALNPTLRVGEQVAEVLRIHRRCSKADAYRSAGKILRAVGIPGERMREYPHQFSGGMRQRVVIAMALACNPLFLIADEPTTALDVTIQAQVLELLNRMRGQSDTALLLITHDLGVVSELCDRVAILYAGQMVETGSLEDIFDHAAHPYTKGLFASLPHLAQKQRRLTPIQGRMPDPLALPAGCSFRPRCPGATEICAAEPPNTELRPGHFVRCHLYPPTKENADVRFA